MQQVAPQVPESLTIRTRPSANLGRALCMGVLLAAAMYVWDTGGRFWCFGLLLVALFGPLRSLTESGRVSLDAEGVTSRTGLRTRRMRWSEVRTANLEISSGGGGEISLRADGGRRFVIPCWDDREWPHVGDPGIDKLGPVVVAERHLLRHGVSLRLHGEETPPSRINRNFPHPPEGHAR